MLEPNRVARRPYTSKVDIQLKGAKRRHLRLRVKCSGSRVLKVSVLLVPVGLGTLSVHRAASSQSICMAREERYGHMKRAAKWDMTSAGRPEGTRRRARIKSARATDVDIRQRETQ